MYYKKNIAEEMIGRAQKAFLEIENYSQKQVDEIVRAIGEVTYNNAVELAQMAIDETKIGKLDDKIIKTQRTAMASWHYMKDEKSVGIIEEDKEKCITVIAKPAGIIACVVPITNPVATVSVNSMQCLKGKNAAIFAPHPKAKKTSSYMVELLRRELKKLNAPEDLIQVIEEPKIKTTQELMSNVDVVVATGGPGMVKAAYSSGKPSYGVGQGNVQMIVDDEYRSYDYMAKMTIENRKYDCGMSCSGEQAIFVSRKEKNTIIDIFKKYGGHCLEGKEILDAFRSKLFDNEKNLNRDFLGLRACDVAKNIGIEVPEGTEVILLKGARTGREDVLAKEILCPIIKIYEYDNFYEAVEKAKANLLMEGAGHSAVIYSNNEEKIAFFADQLPVCRIDVNVSGVFGSGSPYNSGMNPTMSIGCGFWGNNSISDNLTFKHLLNYTRVIRPISDAKEPTSKEVWEE